jgi:dienelactone hydrolase
LRGLIFLFGLALAAQDYPFDYRASRPLEIHKVSSEFRGEIEIQDITFANLTGGRTKAYLVFPAQTRKLAGGLFVHWYEPESPTSNRTQFLDEAVEMAMHGMLCLLPETMWERPDWFKTRDPEHDYEASVQQVKELRRALDVLLLQPYVEPSRTAYIGHDFGAMYGAVMAGVDDRVKVLALQAGTTSFSDWFLLGRKVEGLKGIEAIQSVSMLDPVGFIGDVSGPVLFQFAVNDPYVLRERANEFFQAAKEPKKILWYEAGHGLNLQASKDRVEWLREQLKLK